MLYVHRLRPLRLVPQPAQERSAKVVALRSRREARDEARAPRTGPERPNQAAA
jgi:hypothetical protein